MRRVDQHYVVKNKLDAYDSSITRLSALNKTALSAIQSQEQRLKELQAFLRPVRVSNKQSTTAARKTSTAQNTVPNRKEHYHNKQQRDQSTRLSSSAHTEPKEKTGLPPFIVNLAEVTNSSFTLAWENNKIKLYDVEIRYSITTDGKDREVHQSCSRWANKDPVPSGRVTVSGLEANAEYRNVSLRFRNHLGWSDFSAPISICTSEVGEIHFVDWLKTHHLLNHQVTVAHDFQRRRSQFLYRIDYLKNTIQVLKEERNKIPTRQKKLAEEMKKVQSRLLQLTAELERVFAIDSGAETDTIVTSPVLHGSRQVFSKLDLEKQLQKECVSCQTQIAQSRCDIIRLGNESSELSDKIVREVAKLNDRKVGLAALEQQFIKTASLKCRVSFGPRDVMQHYFRHWRCNTLSALEAMSILKKLASWTRRRIYLKAWRNLQVSATPKQTIENESKEGIGHKLIAIAEDCIVGESREASVLTRELVVTMPKESDAEHQDQDLLDNLLANEETHISSQDDIDLLQKGMIFLRSCLFHSSLKCYEEVLTKVTSGHYFAQVDESAIVIQSALCGKVAQVHYMLENQNNAIVYFNRQLCLANEINSWELQIEATLGLGRCYCAKSEFQYALTLFQQALQLLVRPDTPSSKKVVVYQGIKECLLNLNRTSEAAGIASKIDALVRDVRKERVDSAISDLDTMRQNLMKIEAKRSHAIRLEIASPTLILLQREKAKKERMITEYKANMSKCIENSEKLLDLEAQLKLEIDQATTSTNSLIATRYITGGQAQYKTAELIRRLKDQLVVIYAKKDEAIDESNALRLKIRNATNEVTQIRDRIATETGPLLQRVLKVRRYRCMSLPQTNALRNDVMGKSKGCIELVASTEEECVYLHSISTGKLEYVFTGDEEGRHIGEINGHTKQITALCWFGDGIFTGGMDHRVIGWSTNSKKRLFVARGHEGLVSCIWANSSQLVSGSVDKSIIIWDKRDGTLLRRIYGHARGVHHVISSAIPNSTLSFVSASYGVIFCWKNDVSAIPICHRRLRLPQGNVTALKYGELELITGDNLGFLTLFWIDTGEVLQKVKAHEGRVSSLQVDATKAVSAGHDKVIQVVDIIRGIIIQTLRGHSDPIYDVAFDTSRIVSLSCDGELRTWEWDHRQKNDESRHLESEYGVVV